MKTLRASGLLLAVLLTACSQQAPMPLAPLGGQLGVSAKAPNPVVCVPGFAEPTALWTAVEKHLEKQGRDVTVIALFPHLASVEDGAEKLAETVAAVKKRTGAKQVDLLGHSKGGLVARYYLKTGGTAHVAHMVAISSPNHGVPVPVPAVWRTIDQVKMGSPWMKALNEPDETPGRVKYTTMIGGLDPIVLPHSTSDLEGAENHRVSGATHNSIMFSKKAIALIDAALAK